LTASAACFTKKREQNSRFWKASSIKDNLGAKLC